MAAIQIKDVWDSLVLHSTVTVTIPINYEREFKLALSKHKHRTREEYKELVHRAAKLQYKMLSTNHAREETKIKIDLAVPANIIINMETPNGV